MQTVVDDQHHMIVTSKVTVSQNDKGLLTLMGQQAKKLLGEGFTLLADKGYSSYRDIAACAEATAKNF